MTEQSLHYHGPACDPPHRGEQFLGDHGDEFERIRADERERALDFCCRDNAADLRAKVEALRRPPIPWVPIDDVLALLPEVSE